MKVKLTKRAIEAARVPAGKRDVVLWDAEVPGFACRITEAGGRHYQIFKRSNGRRTRYRLGEHGVLTAEQARKLARQAIAAIERGDDPAQTRKDARTAPTVKELSDRYLREHAEPHKKARSVDQDRRSLEGRILPALGSKRVADVTREDISKLHHRMRKTPYSANRTLALLSKMFNLAEAWGLRPDASNPTRHVKKYPEKKRERYLSELELGRLGKVLATAEQERTELPSVVPAIRLLLFTGARLGEILTLRWDYVDDERGCLRLPDSKTGAKTIVLNPAAIDVLSSLPRGGSPWVIPGAKAGQPLVNLEKPWRRIRKRAKLEDVRLHDLRHSFAAVAAGENLSLHVIGGLLGHREAATTTRYAHLADNPLRRATEAVGSRLSEQLNRRAPKLERVK